MVDVLMITPPYIKHHIICSEFGPLTEELNVQPDSPHEEIDIAQSLTRHIGRKSLAVGNGLHHTVPWLDSQHMSRILDGRLEEDISLT